MDTQVCIICKQPILGYWHELGKNIICQSCAAVTTVYDLFQRGIIDIKPDIVEVEDVVYQDTDSLVTKEDGVNLVEIGRKAATAIATKIENGEMEGDGEKFLFDDGYRYTDEDITQFGKIISEIKGHGFNSEREFFDECQTLYDVGASEEDNPLLILRKKYQEMAPEPRYEGDEGNDTWDAMYAQWEVVNPISV